MEEPRLAELATGGTVTADGRAFAKRYVLGPQLGAGAFGSVYSAEDRLTGQVVAIKRLRASTDRLARIRREISALRMLRIPGVVGLLDDGIDGEHYFLVMERVRGRHFPGASVPMRWPALQPTATALLEALATVHSNGIVHRDLKPANVLVAEDGHPVILDFGLAGGPAMGTTVTRTGAILGTPAYLAPEQVEGRRPDPRADLYSVGVMLFQALSGHLPHQGDTARDLMLARLNRAATPLRAVAPEIPEAIAGVVDQLLSRRQSDRQRTAAEVLRQLTRDAGAVDLPTRRMLGGREVHERVLSLLRTGGDVGLGGLPGAGRTRLLQGVATALQAEGRAVAWLLGGQAPFSSLASLGLGEPPPTSASLQEARDHFVRELARRLRDGLVVIMDELSGIDRWSLSVVCAARGAGAIAGVDWVDATHQVSLPALTQRELRELFHGPDRLLHLREDAARVMHERTHGLPRRVWSEVTAWERSQLAAWKDARLVVSRSAIAELRAGVRLAASGIAHPTASRSASTSGRVHHEQITAAQSSLLGWIGLSWPSADPATLARARGESRWALEGVVEELLSHGLAARLQDGSIGLTAEGAAHARLTEVEALRARSALADTLPPGSDRRLVHLVAAERYSDLAAEAVARAGSLHREGRMTEAAALAGTGLSAARAVGDESLEQQHLALLLRCAVARQEPEGLDEALYELERAGARTPPSVHALARAARQVFTAVGLEALTALRSVPVLPSTELEALRWSLALRASEGCSAAEEAATLGQALDWAQSAGAERASALAGMWTGAHAYRRGDYARSAELMVRALESGQLSVGEQLQALNSAAAAELERNRFRAVIRLADRASALAGRARHAVAEGRAEWLKRTAGYRARRLHEVDHELLDAALALGDPVLVQLVRMTEATIAWRAGERTLAGELAAACGQAWSDMGRTWEPGFARALACASGHGHGDWQDSLALALRCDVPGIGLQVAALLAGTPWQIPPGEDRLRGWLDQVPSTGWEVRMDILTPSEAELMIRRGHGPSRPA